MVVVKEDSPVKTIKSSNSKEKELKSIENNDEFQIIKSSVPTPLINKNSVKR